MDTDGRLGWEEMGRVGDNQNIMYEKNQFSARRNI